MFVQIKPQRKKTYMEQVQQNLCNPKLGKILAQENCANLLSGSQILSNPQRTNKEMYEYSDCKLYLFTYRGENSGSEKSIFYVRVSCPAGNVKK